VNQTDVIIPSGLVTQRNTVVIGHSYVWPSEPIKPISKPRLYYAQFQSLLCDWRFAFHVGALFSSEWQARLWCAYHGFDFFHAELLPRPSDFLSHRSRQRGLRLRALPDFRVERYETHRSRCPDCSRRDREGRGATVWEHVTQRNPSEGLR